MAGVDPLADNRAQHHALDPSEVAQRESGTRTRRRSGRERERETHLVCRACAHRITSPRARIEIAGGHEHVQANPHGFMFIFGCFSEAPGAAVSGEPTTEASWFSGYAWQLVACAACATHLGWFFRGATDSFFGLILERLVAHDTGGK